MSTAVYYFSPVPDSSNGRLLLEDAPLGWSRLSQKCTASCGSSYAILHSLFPFTDVGFAWWTCVHCFVYGCIALHPAQPFTLHIYSWVSGCFLGDLNRQGRGGPGRLCSRQSLPQRVQRGLFLFIHLTLSSLTLHI